MTATPAETEYRRTFAKRLDAAMKAREMTAADLAATVWGKITDNRGYQVARNRDRISVYLSGKGMPEPDNLKKIAAILNVKPEDLAPSVVVSHLERQEGPPYSIVPATGKPGYAAIRVNAVLPLEAASQIATIIAQHQRAEQTP